MTTKEQLQDIIQKLSSLPNDNLLSCQVNLVDMEPIDFSELHREYGSLTFQFRSDKLITVNLPNNCTIVAKCK